MENMYQVFLIVGSENKVTWELNVVIVQDVLRTADMRASESQREGEGEGKRSTPGPSPLLLFLVPGGPYFLFSYSTKYPFIFILKAL